MGDAATAELNQQVLQSTCAVNATILSQATSESQGVTLEASAYSISLLMINAVSTQYSASQINNTAVVTTCAEILKAAAKVV
jgi:hypothetical protein